MKFNITKDESLYIGTLYYEYMTRKDIISLLLQMGTDISDDKLKDFFSEYQEFWILYDYATKEMVNKYSNDIDGRALSWSINFDDCEMTIDFGDIGGNCECISESR